jgi:sirohydrochlorin cobaltochelatase
MFMKNTLRIGAATIMIAAVVISTAACSSTNGSVLNGKPVILVVSFGTSFNDSREKTIGAIEKSIADANPDYVVRRAFTSQTIIDRVAKRDKIKIDNVDQAMKRLKKDGARDIIIQPTHIMEGLEYDDLIKEIKPFEHDFASIKYGKPLLDTDSDFNSLIDIITASTKSYADNNSAIVFMGHGTEHASNKVYAKLDGMLKTKGFPRYFIGTVEATPSLDDVIASLGKIKPTRVVLQPLMIVAGDHANNDMAGSDDDSWKSILEAKGYKVTTILKGLGEDPAIQRLYDAHVKAAQ